MASRPIRLTRRAVAQIDEAARWWADNRLAAPGAVADDLEQGLALIAAHPRIGAMARSPRLRGVRRILLSRVNYYVYYRETPEAIDVLAFWHASRGTPPPL
jgi:plasmid stabilization system protein ParE